MRRTLFILGANSVFAKAIIPILAQDHTVMTAGRNNCDVYCDITKTVHIPESIDVVLNFAAGLGGETYEEIANALNTNVLGVLNICKAAKKAGTRQVINISSIYALAGEGDSNYSTYSITKRQGDELAQYYCGINGLPLAVVRPTRIYGDGNEFGRNQPLLYAIIDKAQNGANVLLYGKNDAKRNYIHCNDLAEVLIRIIEQEIVGAYSCAYPRNVSLTEIATEAQRIFGHGGRTTFLVDRPDIPDDSYPIESIIYDEIGYSPQVSLGEGIRRIKTIREAESN